MMVKMSGLLACAGGLCFAQLARADEAAPPYEPALTDSSPMVTHEAAPDPYGYAWREPGMALGIGVGVGVGGGITGFTDAAMRNGIASSVGGLWDVRATFGTHIPIAFDATYLGTADNVATFNNTPNGTLIGTAFEGAARWNILPHYAVDPYLFLGVGWQHYTLTNAKLPQADSGMQSHSDVADFPMGTGVSLRSASGFTGDLRGTFRPATSSHLLLDQGTGQYAAVHTWEASAALGYEF